MVDTIEFTHLASLTVFLLNTVSPSMPSAFNTFTLNSQREGIELTNEIWDSSIDILIDIYDYALRTRELDGKQHWGVVFRDDYLQQWDNAFLNKRRPGL
jgi:hypothetical protein